MTKVEGPRLELFWRLGQFAAQMGQSLAKAMWRVLGYRYGGKGTAYDRIQLGGIGEPLARTAKVCEALPPDNAYPTQTKIGAKWRALGVALPFDDDGNYPTACA